MNEKISESTVIEKVPLSESSPTIVRNTEIARTELNGTGTQCTNNVKIPHYTSPLTAPSVTSRPINAVQVPFEQNIYRPVVADPLPYHIRTVKMPQSMPQSMQQSMPQSIPQTMPQSIQNPVIPTHFPMPEVGQYVHNPSQQQNYLQYHVPMQYWPESPRVDVREIADLLPEFNPSSDESVSSSQFVQRINVLKNAYNWRDDILLVAVQRKCKEHAKLWIDSQREVFTVWQQFAEILQQAFPFDMNAASAHVTMSNTKQNSNE